MLALEDACKQYEQRYHIMEQQLTQAEDKYKTVTQQATDIWNQREALMKENTLMLEEGKRLQDHSNQLAQQVTSMGETMNNAKTLKIH